MNKLLVAATAMMFSSGCQAVCRIRLLKAKQSTLISSFFRLPPVHTLRGFSTVFGLMMSRDASSVTSLFVLRSKMRKKLL
uniref:Putative secreted peptide n=1 Tax=Anopheles braziliensis TaxID=58242 RepID=A0A2M3ZND8_9DIPT